MLSRKFVNSIILILMVASLILAGVGQVSAQDQAPGQGKGQGKPLPHQLERRVTPADRKAAAKHAADLGLQVGVPTAGVAAPTPGGTPDYFGPYANWAFSPILQKFLDPLPNIPIAVPDTITYPGSDFYVIALQQFTQVSHSSMPATTYRGYVQLNNGTDGTGQNTIAPAPIAYMGPIVLAQRDRPVRVLFINQLPTGSGGDLFIPVDATYMGAGPGPTAPPTAMGTDCAFPYASRPSWCYTQNRDAVHLHGGTTPWISDGTPHQWVAPAGEVADILVGPSVGYVPDMWFDASGNVIPNTVGQVTPPVAGATNDPGPGRMTMYYTNEQSARLMFYHDHAYGITRLNVYAGMAAGYLITDSTEQTLIGGGTIAYTDTQGIPQSVPIAAGTLPDLGTPLVIQDKTFVDATTILNTDPTWNWGTTPGTPNTGDLWFPHVYLPNQNPYDVTGANAIGRWDYGPWFWPPFTGLQFGAIPNPYCLPTPPASGSTEANPGTYDCSATPWEPPFIPGTPSPSGVPEGIMDTPVVNGTAYPTLSVPAGPVRFRILNATDDRYLNLQLYQATSSFNGIVGSITVNNGGSGYTSAPAVSITPAAGDTTGTGATAIATINVTGTVTSVDLYTTGSGYTLPPVVTIAPPTSGTQAMATANLYTAPTEVGMVSFSAAQNAITPFPAWWYTAGNPFVFDDRAGGVPDPRFRGPAMIQIANEGGFLPAPVVFPNQPVNYDYNRRSITVLNVLQHALYLGPAERADILVDFSNYAGQTLIMYNDAPAPMPASDPRLDYYTGDPDQTSMGGAPTTAPGYGPNTRTIMQINVAGTPATAPGPVDDYNPATVATLQTALTAAFAASQDQILVPQTPYNAVYGTNVAATDASQYVRIQDTTHTFTPIHAAAPITVNMGPKSIIEDFTVDYGRMNGILGNEIPNTNITNQTSILQGYVDPPVELLQVSTGKDIQVTPEGTLADGTQIWKYTHNGVDTHVIHLHMFTFQVINRVGWDGAIKPVDANELGWKETVRANPLEDIIVAMRPIALTLPFDLPNSVRLMDTAHPAGTTNAAGQMGFNQVDPLGNPVTIVNDYVNFGWEYVQHCHILGHEEMDMMRPMSIAVPPVAPGNLAVTQVKKTAVLTWTDNSLSETGFVVQRMDSTNVWTTLATVPGAAGAGSILTYTDTTFNSKQTPYTYRVYATNVVGSTASSGFTLSAGGGYPTLTVNSAMSNLYGPPAAPSNVVASQPGSLKTDPVVVTWTDNAYNEQNFTVQRSTSATGPWTTLTTLVPASPGVGATVLWYDTKAKSATTYYYQVMATNFLGASAPAVGGPITTR